VIELAAERRPDIVVATGDLTHDASQAAYEMVRQCFGRLGVPVYCLPGNHDEAAALHQHMTGNAFHSTASLQINGWQMAFVDSTVSGSEGGHLRRQELETLHSILAGAPDRPALVWLHNPADFFDVIDRHPQVRAVVWGHVHQCFEHRRNEVPLLSTPSTCIQFLPGSDDFAIDQVPPGYRWFDLYDDASFTTGVERLASIPGSIDLGARGY
jgi:Icc protein